MALKQPAGKSKAMHPRLLLRAHTCSSPRTPSPGAQSHGLTRPSCSLSVFVVVPLLSVPPPIGSSTSRLDTSSPPRSRTSSGRCISFSVSSVLR